MTVQSAINSDQIVYQRQPESTTKNSLISTIGHYCSLILTPEESPTWKRAAFKACLGAASRVAIEFHRIPDFGGYGSYMNLAGECLSTGLTMTGFREIGYLAYTKLAYKPAETRNLKVGTRGLQRKHIKVATLAEKNAQLAKLIKAVKLITITGMSLHCLYNYDYLGNFHLFNGNYSFVHHAKLYSLNSLPYVTNVELQLAQIAACALSVFMNCKQLKTINDEEEFLKDNPISEIVNTFACASFFSQLNAVSTEAQNWYQCMLPNVRSCFQRRLKDPSKSCQHDLYEKCLSLLPQGRSGARLAKKYLESIKNYWLMELHHLGNTDTTIKIGYLQLKHFQSWTKEYALILPLKNAFSLIKKNAYDYWNQQPFITKEKKEAEIDLEKSKVKEENIEIIEYLSDRSNKEKIVDETPVSKNQKNYNVSDGNKVHKDSLLKQSLKERRRKKIDALEKLRSLSYPADTRIIDKELKKATEFVNGEIKESGRYRRSLVWNTGKSIMRLDYEIPSEIQGKKYSGNKLAGVVNVLRSVYNIGLDDSVIDQDITNSHELEKKPRPRTKTKRHGIANKNKAQKKPLVQQSSTEIIKKSTFVDEREKERREALARLNLLPYPVNKKIIKRELMKAADFVNGKRVKSAGKGSARYLVWNTEKSTIRLKYEVPHESDRNMYRSNKYRCVMNVLKAAYLIGLDDAAADKYIKEYHMERLYRIDKFAHYIFSNKTTV